jgi:hypothetical protein
MSWVLYQKIFNLRSEEKSLLFVCYLNANNLNWCEGGSLSFLLKDFASKIGELGSQAEKWGLGTPLHSLIWKRKHACAVSPRAFGTHHRPGCWGFPTSSSCPRMHLSPLWYVCIQDGPVCAKLAKAFACVFQLQFSQPPFRKVLLQCHCVCVCVCVCVCGSTGVWTQGFVLVKQTLYHLTPSSSPFCFSYFSDRVSWFLPGPALDHDLLTYAPQVAGIKVYTSMPGLFAVMGVGSHQVYLGWPWTVILLPVASHVAGMTGTYN